MNDVSETVNQIVEMWNNGHTSGDIAKRIGLTRDAVMGRITRLRDKGIVLRAASKTTKPERSDEIKFETKQSYVRKKPVVFYAKPIEQLVFDYEPVNTGTDIMQLTPQSCRYIVGHDRRRGALYCAEIKHYRSYCKEHADLCYIVKKPNT